MQKPWRRVGIELVKIKTGGFRPNGGQGCPTPQRIGDAIIAGIARKPDVGRSTGLVLDDIYVTGRIYSQVIRAGQRGAHSRAGSLVYRGATRKHVYLIRCEIEGASFERCRGSKEYHLLAIGHVFIAISSGAGSRFRARRRLLTGHRCCHPR